MLNNEIDSLQEVLSLLNNYNNYTTYIEVSPLLYIYFRQKYKQSSLIFANKEYPKYPETLCGCKIFINMELDRYDYNIIRKENSYEE